MERRHISFGHLPKTISMREKPVLKSDNVDDPVKFYTGIGVALGVAFDSAFGALFSDTGTGLVLGLCLGLVTGAHIGTKKKAQNAEKERQDAVDPKN